MSFICALSLIISFLLEMLGLVLALQVQEPASEVNVTAGVASPWSAGGSLPPVPVGVPM